MIKLNLPKESYWLDLQFGVRLKVKPLTTAIYSAARYEAQRRVRRIQQEITEAKAAGGSVQGLPDLEDESALMGFSQFLFAQSLAKAALEAWEGVLDGEGNPAEMTPEAVDELMRIHSMAEDFLVQYTASYMELIEEGESSAAGADGTSAEGRNTADAAAS